MLFFRTCLHTVAWEKNERVGLLKKLISAGASPDLSEKDGGTALSDAIYMMNLEISKVNIYLFLYLFIFINAFVCISDLI